MIQGLIGKKIGMTQIFDEAGNAIPVTVIQAGPCVVVQKKTTEKEGYSSVQLGLVEADRKVRANQPLQGHFKKSGLPPTAVLKEFVFSEDEENPVNPGDQVLAEDVFQVNQLVDVTGRVKGRGFQGVIKRHGFHGGKATHGSMFHRAPGSIGASADPSRVYPGQGMPGQMGNNTTKIQKLRVVEIDQENHLVLIKGSVPGSRGGYVVMTRSEKE